MPLNPEYLFGNTQLIDVETLMKEKLGSDAPLLTEISCYLLNLGGKRIRPILCLSAARFFGMDSASRELLMACAGIELIHMATLLHDDIIDKSPTRRANISAFCRYGIEPTLLAGDFLLVKAFGICSELDQFIVKNTERACIELTEGELLEGNISRERIPNVEEYLNIVSKKTASLFSLATAVGAFCAKASPRALEHMNRFGRQAGIAFQMIDDILDVVADEDLLGKPVGTDLRQKTPTLINILWLEEQPDDAQEFFALGSIGAAESLQALDSIKSSCVIPRAREIAQSWAQQAKDSLYAIEEATVVESVREELAQLLNYTLVRCL